VQRLRYVFLSSDEATELRALEKRGVKVTAQDLPGARCVPLEDLLNGSDL
jgi:mannose/fructose/N-acetylgalactosamine-specific phosphotransferase system component IIB